MTNISIVMPAYNAENFIKESLDSVLSQTFKNWELIIVEDGSTDKTLEILREYESEDERIKVFPNDKNRGVSFSRNRGIKKTNFDWIAFIDSDDIWKENKLEKQINLANEKNAEFIFTGSEYINENSELYPGVFNVPLKVDYKKLQNHNAISTSSVLIKKRLLDNDGFENDKIHEDYALWLRVLEKGTVAYGLNEVMLTYRLHRNSKSGNKLKTFKMTYGVFRHNNLSIPRSVRNTLCHLYNSVIKYHSIFNRK